MRIRTTFTLILSATFVVAMMIMALIAHHILYENAAQEIRERSDLMLGAASAMRTYTTGHIKPLIAHGKDDVFHAESIPAFAAMRAFDLMRDDRPDYTYREAALNPTNPSDRAVDWEKDIITDFRDHPDHDQVTGTRSTPIGDIMFIAKPIKVGSESCLECHSTPDAAPASLVKTYGVANGFGWKKDEVIGAQIVAVPTSVSIARARRTFGIFMLSMAAAAVLVVAILNFTLRRLVVRPIADLSERCDQVSTGDFSSADPEYKGDDEISSLGRSFTRMKISLQKALRMLQD